MKLSRYLDKLIAEVNAHNDKLLDKARADLHQSDPAKYPVPWSRNSWSRILMPPEVLSALPLRKLPTKAELESRFGGKFTAHEVLAKIGTTGKEVHKVTAQMLDTPDGYIVWSAQSHCGSQRYSHDGFSPIFVHDSNDLSQVTCDRCLGIRIKGGKPKPASKRKVIDPDSRPKQWKFRYKVDYLSYPGRTTPPAVGVVREETVKGMTEEEAQEKLYKREMPKNEANRFYSKVYDFELLRVWSWNGKTLWKADESVPGKSRVIYSVSMGSSSGGKSSSPAGVGGVR